MGCSTGSGVSANPIVNLRCSFSRAIEANYMSNRLHIKGGDSKNIAWKKLGLQENVLKTSTTQSILPPKQYSTRFIVQASVIA